MRGASSTDEEFTLVNDEGEQYSPLLKPKPVGEMQTLIKTSPAAELSTLHQTMTTCTRCPRLVAWREQVAMEKTKRFAADTYWGKPVPSWGDPLARLLIVGLAPAAHGGNRTGRAFTGDRSGDWLYRALHKAGFANQPHAVNANDGLILTDCYITQVIHCAPPLNQLLPSEIINCRPYMIEELRLLTQVKVIIALGQIAHDQILQVLQATHPENIKPYQSLGRKPKFTHNSETCLDNGFILIGSYHPSQQNTFTGKLTEPMLDAVFARVQQLINSKN